MVSEWSKALSQIQVERMPLVPGANHRSGLRYRSLRSIYVKEFYYLICPPLSFDHQDIEINNIDKPSLYTGLFIGE